MTIAELTTEMLVGGGSSALAAYGLHKINLWRDKHAVNKTKTDGRTPAEWYELIKGLGKAEYEKLSRGSLDGLEESDTYGRWDVKPLLGSSYHILMREWYPEKYCQYCGNEKNANGSCFWDGPCHGVVDEQRKKVQKKKVDGVFMTEAEYNKSRRAIPTQKNIPAPPPRGGSFVSITENYDAEMLTTVYVITKGSQKWTARAQDIKNFQIRKSLKVDGVVGPKTSDAIIGYLNAGNSWPVPVPTTVIRTGPVTISSEGMFINGEDYEKGLVAKKTMELSMNELKQMQAELEKWNLDAAVQRRQMELGFTTSEIRGQMKKISRYDRNGKAHW